MKLPVIPVATAFAFGTRWFCGRASIYLLAADFLEAVQPGLAVISAGQENPYGLPSPVLLGRLQQAEVRVLRADQNGAIHIATDGRQLEVSCVVACPQIDNLLNSGWPEVPLQQENNE